MKHVRLLLGALLLAATLAACDVSPSAPAGATALPIQVSTSQPAPDANGSYPAPDANGSYPAPDANGSYPAPTSAP